jgi:hypothetical protein
MSTFVFTIGFKSCKSPVRELLGLLLRKLEVQREELTSSVIELWILIPIAYPFQIADLYYSGKNMGVLH